LIGPYGDAQLTDIGLSKLLEDISDDASAATSWGLHGNAVRFTAPELLVSSVGKTPESDVYAFAMTLFQV
jgi:hypothetical protein